jgi:hypothetical protein
MNPPTPATIDDVIARLTAIIDESRKAQSPIGYFAALYRRITMAVNQSIARKEFDDNERMDRIDVTFASRYLEALDQFRSGKPPSAPWAVAFRAAGSPGPLVLQHLLLGVNAHVNLDLGIAIATVCPGAALDSVKNDFFKLNAILASQVDTVRRELSDFCFLLRWTSLLGRPEDRLVDLAVDLGRDYAWHFAQKLAPTAAPEQGPLIEQAAKEAAGFANDILSPDLLLDILFSIVRLTEQGTVASRIAHLAGSG